jgi:hypothetical protein
MVRVSVLNDALVSVVLSYRVSYKGERLVGTRTSDTREGNNGIADRRQEGDGYMEQISYNGNNTDSQNNIVNAERRGKRQVMIRPSSKVVVKVLAVMQKHGMSMFQSQPPPSLPGE